MRARHVDIVGDNHASNRRANSELPATFVDNISLIEDSLISRVCLIFNVHHQMYCNRSLLSGTHTENRGGALFFKGNLTVEIIYIDIMT